MYIISLSETWHPFIHFLEKNNLSGFFLWKNSFGHQEYMLQVLDMAVTRGIFSQTSQSTWGWGMICWLVDPNLNHGLQEWFGQSSPVFFWVVTPPPLFIIGHCDKSRKHGKISIALPWLQVQSQFSLKPSLKAEFLVLVATFGNPHHGSNQTKFPVVRKHTIFLKMKSMSMYIMTIMSRSMMIYLENVREPTYSRFDD